MAEYHYPRMTSSSARPHVRGGAWSKSYLQVQDKIHVGVDSCNWAVHASRKILARVGFPCWQSVPVDLDGWCSVLGASWTPTLVSPLADGTVWAGLCRVPGCLTEMHGQSSGVSDSQPAMFDCCLTGTLTMSPQAEVGMAPKGRHLPESGRYDSLYIHCIEVHGLT